MTGQAALPRNTPRFEQNAFADPQQPRHSRKTPTADELKMARSRAISARRRSRDINEYVHRVFHLFHLGDACTPMPTQPSWLSWTRIHRTKEREHPGVDSASCHLPSTLQAFGHSGPVNRPNRQVRSSAARYLTRGYRAVLSRDLTASMLHAPGPDVNR